MTSHIYFALKDEAIACLVLHGESSDGGRGEHLAAVVDVLHGVVGGVAGGSRHSC